MVVVTFHRARNGRENTGSILQEAKFGASVTKGWDTPTFPLAFFLHGVDRGTKTKASSNSSLLLALLLLLLPPLVPLPRRCCRRSRATPLRFSLSRAAHLFSTKDKHTKKRERRMSLGAWNSPPTRGYSANADVRVREIAFGVTDFVYPAELPNVALLGGLFSGGAKKKWRTGMD